MPDPRQRFRPADVPDTVTREVIQSLSDAAARATSAQGLVPTGPWIDVAGGVGFQNAWVDYGPPYALAAYVINADGWVFIKGHVKNGVVGPAIFTLPVGFRPSEQHAFIVSSGGAGGLEVYVNGDVKLAVGVNAFAQISCIFRAA